jgi:predicted amidohydrolase YtcJ
MRKITFIFSLILLIIVSCKTNKQEVDTIFYNARVYTVNDGFEIATGFAVKDGKFVGVGTLEKLKSNFTAKEEFDLEGKAVYPGFYDAHCHFFGYGLSLQKADLRGTKSFDEVIERVRQFATENPSEWILGRSWDQNDWEDKEFPTNDKLNAAFPNTPVVLTRVDGHALIANDEALRRAGITIQSRIDGGDFIKKNGKLTGVLIDNAEEILNKAIPGPDDATIIRALLKGQKNCFSVGLTSVVDAGLPYKIVKMIDSLQNADTLLIRVYAMLSPSAENIENFVKKGIYSTDRLNVRCIKLYADGALGSRGACLIQPYSDDPKNYGLIVEDINKLREYCKIAYDNNYQVATHCIGDSANRLMLNLYGEFLRTENDKRWRIEHAQVIDKDDFGLFKKFSIVPSVQATHATSDMYWAGKRLGPERIKYAYAYKSLLDLTGWLPAGSDFPVEEINPLFGFYAAVARMDQEYYPEGGFQPDEAITREQALRGMTIWAAKSNFEEKERGSIEPGKFADFVILEKDIMEIDIREVFKVKVLGTYIDGKKVF